MRKLKLTILATAAIALMVGLAFGTGVIAADSTVLQTFDVNGRLFVYSVKFICNLGNPANAEDIGLVPGEYKTDINIHNPSLRKANATILKKFTLALPEPEQPTGTAAPPFVQAVPTPYVTRVVILGPDAAIRVDCKEIQTLLQPFLCPSATNCVTAFKGFVEIVSNISNLDVVAEYTAESFDSAGTSTGISVDVVVIQGTPLTP